MAHFALTVVDPPPGLQFARIRASFSCEICGRLTLTVKVYMPEFVIWVSGSLTADNSEAPQKRAVAMCHVSWKLMVWQKINVHRRQP